MTVWLDPTSDADFDDLVALAPYTISLEGFEHDRLLLYSTDTGASGGASVTSEQEAALCSAFAAEGLSDGAIEYLPPGSKRRFRRSR